MIKLLYSSGFGTGRTAVGEPMRPDEFPVKINK